MSHSLRVKIKGLQYKGIITDKDCDRLCKALDNEDVLDKIRDEIEDNTYFINEVTEKEGIDFETVVKIIDKYMGMKDTAIEALEQQSCEDPGEISDGYHTFNQLYHQRAILFATIVNQNTEIAWKSFKHSDGEYCFNSNGEWFIVGIDTPEGSYTYHYSKEYWDMFDCQELECGKEWDGHTEEDVTRLLSLPKIGHWVHN